ncbi:MAG: hypothetical protein PUI67_02520, partial [Collinsella sp.]|nr:hypothetical protein [Collinsella sp.]MDY6150326.1 hypothetical protein [Collinsella sp.]
NLQVSKVWNVTNGLPLCHISLALLMYLFSVSCITHFMGVARRRHPKSMVLASSVKPMGLTSASRLTPQWAAPW